MKYLSSIKVSMPAKTNLDKAKSEFSFLGKPQESYKETYEFTGFKIENAFNDTLFLEEFNKTVNFKLDLLFLDCAFVFATIQIESKEPLDLKILNKNSFYFNERKELNKIDIKSIAEILEKLILSRYYNLKSFNKMIDNVDIEMNHAERWNTIVQSINDNTCVLTNKNNFTLSTSSGGWYIEGENYPSSELLINQKKLKVWHDEHDENEFYFNGDIDKLIKILMHEHVAKSKLSDGVNILNIALHQIDEKAKEVLKKLTNTNPAYWANLSISIEAEQLYYIETQALVYKAIENFRNSNYLKNELTEKRYNQLKETFDRKIELIFQLSNEVNYALQNISTPIKSKNDFKLQESTDKVNERILFLSFVAMSVPLISWVTSTEISNKIKLFSGFIILLLPFLYYIINSFYKRKLISKNKLNVFKDELSDTYKNIDFQKKLIEKIKSDNSNSDKERIYAIQIGACESNIKIHKEHIRKLEEKIKTM